MKLLPCQAADFRTNHLLNALPDAVWRRWGPFLEPIRLELGQFVSESGRSSDYVYFPTTAIVSLIYLTLDGGSAEVAVVGNDGVVGIALLMGGTDSPSRAQVQSAGHALRMRAEVFKEAMGRSGALLGILLRYTQSIISQASQSALCNRYHSIDQKVSRRLLLGLDRSPSAELVMTQDLLASLLGVRRESVTAAALKLQQAGAIRYSRGHIKVLDRAHLEQRTCECYASAGREYRRIFPLPLAA